MQDPLMSELILHFYSGCLNFNLKPEDVQLMNWEWQQKFLNATLNCELVRKYPVSSQFSKLFLKKIILSLEPIQEVHDEFYSKLCSAMNEVNNDFNYQHYVMESDLNNVVTIKETKNMVINGTTGLKTWQAALMLADWALCNKNKFSNKNILELGSGVGFTGMTIAKLCNVKSLLLSDCHGDVLKTACENVQINFSHYKQEVAQNGTIFKAEDHTLGVIMLDWNNIEDLPGNTAVDIVIGADIVYDPSILQPLCNVIKTLTTRNVNLEVYIASVIRNEKTFNSFLETLSKMNFTYEKLELTKSVFIRWDESVEKCLLKIKVR